MSVRAFKMADKRQKRNIKAHNVIWANQNTGLVEYRWLHAHAMFDVTCFPLFVGAMNIISSVLRYICLSEGWNLNIRSLSDWCAAHSPSSLGL